VNTGGPDAGGHPRAEPGFAARYVEAARPKTLPAAAAPVLLGTAMALSDDAFHGLAAALALLAAVSIQIATNFHNDVADFEKGADRQDRSGPRRMVAAGLISPRAMRRAVHVAMGCAVLFGSWLMWRGGWPVVAVGAASIASALAYTGGKRSLAYLGIADLFVLIFFGPVAVAGTHYVQTLVFSPAAVIVGLGPGLLSMAILLVNNIRDRHEDQAAGKRTLVVRVGREGGIRLFRACLAAALSIPVVAGMLSLAPWTVLIALLASPQAWSLHRALVRAPVSDPRSLNPLLGRTARLLLVYCILFSVGYVI